VQIDHAYLRFHSIVRQTLADVSGIRVAWGRYQGTVTYPWVGLQVIVGPNTTRIQRTQAQRQTVEVVVQLGVNGDLVAVVIGGRYLQVTYATSAELTAEALAALMPAHWTVVHSLDTVTVSGPDVFGGAAYFGLTVANTPVGDLLWVNCHRRDVTIQTDIWTQLDANGRPARWHPTGCDTLALRVRDALWDSDPGSPWRVVIRPSDVIRPMSESFPDGREYMRASFDSVVSWLDVVAERQYGAEVSSLEETSGTIETSSDGTAFVVDEFTIDETLDP
jgi:hypothetical protein